MRAGLWVGSVMVVGDGTGVSMGVSAAALAPEIVLFLGALLVLMSGSFLPRHRLGATGAITLGVLTVSGAAAVISARSPSTSGSLVFDDTFGIDSMTTTARLVIAAGIGLLVLMSRRELSGDARRSETYALMLLAGTGASLMAGARDLMLLIVSFVLASIPLYGLIGLARTARAAEATMKTYLLGALAGVGLMLGVVLLFAVTGETTYTALSAQLSAAPARLAGLVTAALVLVVAALMFKVGAVPAHFWVPDAAQGANLTAAAFLTTIPKVGAVVAVFRLVQLASANVPANVPADVPADVPAGAVVAVLAAVSMTVGNLAAYPQRDVRRLLGWSTVSQAGYLLVPAAAAGASDLARPAMLFYLAGYAATNVAAFAVAAALPQLRDLADFAGLARARPKVGAALVVALLGLVGTPPTAVFIGKLTTASAAWDGGMAWLSVTVMVNSLISLFYYLRWVVPVVQAPAVRDLSPIEHHVRLRNVPDRLEMPQDRARPGAAAARGAAGPSGVVDGDREDRARAPDMAALVAVVASTMSVLLGVAAGLLWPLL